MFRVVVKSNLDSSLAHHLANHIEDIIPILNRMEHGMNNITTQKEIEEVQKTLIDDGGDYPMLRKKILNVMQINQATHALEHGLHGLKIAEDTVMDDGSERPLDIGRKNLLRQAGRLHIASSKMMAGSSGKKSFAAC